MEEAARPQIRLDKWLWHARFFKTRSLSARVVSAGHVRINGTKSAKPAARVGPGDTLTFAQGDDIRVVRIIAPGARRGPAAEAQALYDDLTPIKDSPATGRQNRVGKRPTKKDRRDLEQTRRPPLD